MIISGAEALYGVCAMCGAFALMMIIGWLPDNVCKQCRMLFSEDKVPQNMKEVFADDVETPKDEN